MRSSVFGNAIYALAFAGACLSTRAPAQASEDMARTDYIVLGDEAEREKVAQWIAGSALNPTMIQSSASGMQFASCVDTWKAQTDEAVACIQSRMATPEAGAKLVLHMGLTGTADEDSLSCIGPDASHRLVLTDHTAEARITQFENCVSRALEPKSAAKWPVYAIRSGQAMPPDAPDAFDSGAAAIMTIAVDHVGIPRGSKGWCLVDGRVKSIERGAGLSPAGLVYLTIPCADMPDRYATRHIAMKELVQGTYATLYLDAQQTLIDYRLADPQ